MLTQRFLALCEHHGSQRLAVRMVAVGRSIGVGLPASDDWTASRMIPLESPVPEIGTPGSERLYISRAWPPARKNARFPGRLWTEVSLRHGS